MSEVTCPICEQKISLIPDGILRYCPCHCLGVDHTKEYTRYLGTIPIEDERYAEFEEKHRATLKQIRKKITFLNIVYKSLS